MPPSAAPTAAALRYARFQPPRPDLPEGDEARVSDQGVIVLDVPIPSSSPLFLTIVAIHVAAGLACALTGIVAMCSVKGPGRHPSAGIVYFWSLLVVFLTMAALSALRWPKDTHLFILGILTFGAGVIGRMARRRHSPGWLPVHVTAMAVSCIVLLTAFYVDNGPTCHCGVRCRSWPFGSFLALLASQFWHGRCDAIRSFAAHAPFHSFAVNT